MKIEVPKKHCKGCLWLVNRRLCTFKRCVKGYGFIADKKVMNDEQK